MFMNMTDDELVEQLRVGEDSAFDALYERHAASLLADTHGKSSGS